MSKNPYHRHRFPAEIISHCVWLYNCFSLSFRDIEKMAAVQIGRTGTEILIGGRGDLSTVTAKKT
jgi:hypothetical protein